ncbi:MAG: SGNH/GDSL hydrolase family protein [Chitinophagaceae bacterium]|jgi:lysophospholipase L1-like esterase|nr:SGNH/GDSL hydrolase family protein [Chitinophagaceae bacterium]
MSYKLVLFALFITCLFLMAFRSDRKKKILFFGDSITEAAVKPGGYIRVMEDLLRQQGRENDFELLGSGISGNKVYDLYLRLEEDLFSQKPDLVVIYIGVNDVWHKTLLGTGTDYDKFGRFYTALVRKIQASGAKVVLCTPAVIGEKHDASNPQDGDLNQYSKWIRGFAAEQHLPLVDLRQQFLDYSKQNNPNNKESGILTTDRVHLNEAGNRLVAEAMWKVISQK